MPAIPGGHPPGRRYPRLKIAPDNFLCLQVMSARTLRPA